MHMYWHTHVLACLHYCMHSWMVSGSIYSSSGRTAVDVGPMASLVLSVLVLVAGLRGALHSACRVRQWLGLRLTNLNKSGECPLMRMRRHASLIMYNVVFTHVAGDHRSRVCFQSSAGPALSAKHG
jgi:hypothetical protein